MCRRTNRSVRSSEVCVCVDITLRLERFETGKITQSVKRRSPRSGLAGKRANRIVTSRIPVREAQTVQADLEQLAWEARNGRARAFDRLAEALLPRVQRWAMALVGSPDDADDVAQEVLLKMHRALKGFAFGSRVTTWVYAVTRRTAADYHRKRNRRARLLSVYVQPAAAEIEEHSDQRELSELVYSEYRKLPGRQREIFDLADLQGLLLEDIAQLLELHPTTVRVHLHRARKAIRSRIISSHAALVEDRHE
jgi:RNA polymerase sigma-70 factor (ECF subfamily)